MSKKQLTGKIISNKTPGMVIVRVETMKEHPKYKRKFKMHKNYKAQTGQEECFFDETVLIEECPPISKDKKWKVIKKLTTRIGDGSEEPSGSSA